MFEYIHIKVKNLLYVCKLHKCYKEIFSPYKYHVLSFTATIQSVNNARLQQMHLMPCRSVKHTCEIKPFHNQSLKNLRYPSVDRNVALKSYLKSKSPTC